MTPPNNTPEAPAGRPSFLDELLKESVAVPPTEPAVISQVSPLSTAAGTGSVPPLAATTASMWVPSASISPVSTTPTSTIPVIKKVNPITPAAMFQAIGALLFVALVFFGSFLAYIVFNPAQARFFNTFGINTADVASLLSTLVNGIFGSLTFILSCLFVYFLFRTYLSKWAPKKRAIYAIVSTLMGIILFSNIGFWAYLFGKIGSADFVRPSGGVIVYDNDLALSDAFRNQASVSERDLQSLIGPISLRYDLSSDARYATKSMEIASFTLDCGDGITKHEGSSPESDKSLICTYTRKGSYTPKWSYKGRDNITRDPATLDITFSPVKVTGVVEVNRRDNNIVFDATDLAALGKLKWFTGKDFKTLASEDAKFTMRIDDTEQYVCLSKNVRNDCDRVFTIKSKADSPIVGTIKYQADASEPLKYNFSLVDARAKSGGEIEKYTWFIDDTKPFSNEENASWLFPTYGNYKISVELVDSARNKVLLTERIKIDRPLSLVRKPGSESLLRVLSEDGQPLLAGSYNRDLGAYLIDGITVPQKLTFDASDVRVKNDGYTLKEILWKVNGEERKGLKIDYDFVEEKRYEVSAEYVFSKTGTQDETRVTERIVVDGKVQEISPKLVFTQEGGGDSDNLFVPLVLNFDASASRVRSGKIAQFIYDFGEGKAISEGPAITQYRYMIPGTYTIKLTVQKDDGTKASTSRSIVVKDLPKKVDIKTSVSSWLVGKSVEFEAVGTTGQIESYAWNFGDASAVVTTPTASHTYERAGKYTVILTATYTDGTLMKSESVFEVGE